MEAAHQITQIGYFQVRLEPVVSVGDLSAVNVGARHSEGLGAPDFGWSTLILDM